MDRKNWRSRAVFLALVAAAVLSAWSAVRTEGPAAGVLFVLALALSFAAGASLAGAVLLSRVRDLEEEARLSRERKDAVRAGYEDLLRHNEEIRKLRHDMKKHFYALRQLAEGSEPQIVQYVDELVRADEAVRPVVHSGPALLSALLNGALGKAIGRGVDVRVLQDKAPSTLSLSDKDLTSLVLNVMDNALDAVLAPGLEEPFLHVSLHTKGTFFFFSVENARSPDGRRAEPDPKAHQGLGLRIIREIVDRNGGLVQIDQEDPTRFRVQTAFPI